jgi:D-ribose pyranase
MKKSRILNKYLNNAIASMGHGDILIISDAGFPIPEGKRIDLAIEQDKPGILEILDLVTSDLIYERAIVATEQKDFNPILFDKVTKICDRCSIETITHKEIIEEFTKKAKYIIRTGGFEPWGNIILYSGVDAPIWFEKPGTKVPDYYQERADYKEE